MAGFWGPGDCVRVNSSLLDKMSRPAIEEAIRVWYGRDRDETSRRDGLPRDLGPKATRSLAGRHRRSRGALHYVATEDQRRHREGRPDRRRHARKTSETRP